MERISKWVKVRIALGLKGCVLPPRTFQGGGLPPPPPPPPSSSTATTTTTSPPLPAEVNHGGGSSNSTNSRGAVSLTGSLRLSRSGFRSSKKICSICLGSMQAGKGHALFTAECSHTFHFHCIASNVKHGNHICPICRAKWKEVPFEAPSSSCDPPQGRNGRVNPVYLPQGNEMMAILHRLPHSQSYNRQQQPFNIEPSSFADDEPLNQHQQSHQATCQQHRCANEADMKVLPEFSAIPRSSMNDNLAVLIHLKSPMTSSFKDCDKNGSSVAASHTAAASRAPVDLVAVLDISGSMAGTKLALLKQAMGFVIQNLGSSDRLSVVAFSSTARRLFHLRRMTETGKQEALQAVNSLMCSGGTNIAQGLRKGAKVVEERREKNPVCSIILLSDGQDTYRMCSIHATSHLPAAAAAAADYRKFLPHSIRGAGIPVHAFGFGADHDSASLHSISEISGGTFSFIEAEDTIQDAFAQCIGGLLSVVVQCMLVSIECIDSGIHIQSIKSGSYTSCIANDSRSGSISVGDLYAEEERDFLAFANVPPLLSGDSSNSQETTVLLRVGCSYTDPLTKESVHIPHQLVRISRPDIAVDLQDAAAASSSYSMEVDRQKNRLLATEAIVEAKAAAERGELSLAISILEDRRQSMLNSVSGQSGDVLCGILDVEMREMQERMTSRQRYEACGRAYVLSGLSSHSWQRATARGGGGGDSMSSNSLFQAYQTSTMTDMVQRSQTLSTGSGRSRSSKRPPIRPSLSFPASR